MAKLAKALNIKPYQLLLPEEDENASVHIHKDLSELSKNLKNSIDLQIKDLIQKYAD